MSDQAHPQIGRMIEEFRAVISLLDEQVRRMQRVAIVVSDQTGTVEVTMNGHLRLTGLVIDPDIMALGAQEVTKRINEAVCEATEFADEWADEDLVDLEARVADALAKLNDLPPPT
ncbi:YbaB/EbfC family nucleoid-associated protein [Mycobacterium sp. E1747]|uniref:YbaB/EbfC family nucleoid-associated protein n=1 Tax=Mycobacterium sp. E1747 TaxID=1834128 RepID=UPI000801351B|nr:YbaB/EbfC family nucleoid-associated protein [Mycobacterium sp. E1747]OBH14055.1 hypothetical protein A5695_12705 [Mycobacterium sp. E1747]